MGAVVGRAAEVGRAGAVLEEVAAVLDVRLRRGDARRCRRRAQTSVGCVSGSSPVARPSSPKVSKLKVSVMTTSVGANSSLSCASRSAYVVGSTGCLVTGARAAIGDDRAAPAMLSSVRLSRPVADVAPNSLILPVTRTESPTARSAPVESCAGERGAAPDEDRVRGTGGRVDGTTRAAGLDGEPAEAAGRGAAGGEAALVDGGDDALGDHGLGALRGAGAGAYGERAPVPWMVAIGVVATDGGDVKVNVRCRWWGARVGDASRCRCRPVGVPETSRRG